MPSSANPGERSVASPLDVSRRRQLNDRRPPSLTLDPHPKLRDTLPQSEFARLEFLFASDADLESRLWFGLLVAARGERDVVLHAGLSRLLADRLHARLVAGEWRAHREFLIAHLAHRDPVERLELELRLALVEGRGDDVRGALQRVLAELRRTPHAGRRRDLARWAKAAVAEAVPAGAAPEESAWLAAFAAQALGDPGGAMLARAGTAALPGWLDDALPAYKQEWEKAARGEKGLEYPWGNEYRSGLANVAEKRDKPGPWFLEQTTAVGVYSHGASPYGVLDLSGNVWEWCLNDHDDRDGRPGSVDLRSEAARVLRGGSWFGNPDDARASSRYWRVPDYHLGLIGFRALCASSVTS